MAATIGCPIGSWWNGVRCAEGDPADLFPQSANYNASAEEKRWRVIPIPGKIPFYWHVERLDDAEGLVYLAFLEVNCIVYRADGVNSEYWTVRTKRTYQLPTGYLGYMGSSSLAPTLTVVGSRNTSMRFSFYVSSVSQNSETPALLSLSCYSGSNAFGAAAQASPMWFLRYTGTDQYRNGAYGYNGYTPAVGDLTFFAGFFSAFAMTDFTPAPLSLADEAGIPRFDPPMSDLIRKPLIPQLTSASTAATASSQQSNYEAWRAFQRTSNQWVSNAVPSVGSPQWLKVDLGEPTVISRYAFNAGHTSFNSLPAGWKLEGSTDGATWTTLDERTATDAEQLMTGQSAIPQVSNTTFPFENTTAYRWYRLVFTGLMSMNSSPQRVGVGRFQLYGAYSSYPPPFAMVSISAGGITLLNNSAQNPLAADVSGYDYETLCVNFEGMVPVMQSGVQFSFFNKQTGAAIYAYGYWSGKQLQIYNLRDLWYGLNQPTGIREIEIRLFDGIYGYYGSNVSAQDSFFTGSIWIDFQP